MFKKIVIRNVGVLKAFEAGNSPQLSKLSLFYARNGRGKSTLTAVMRAARDGCSSTIMARRSLGNNETDPEITLVTDNGNLRFSNKKWVHSSELIEVFDSAFIADNIFAGEMIELEHDRGLFSIIIGGESVHLAKLLERFKTHAKVRSPARHGIMMAMRGRITSTSPAPMWPMASTSTPMSVLQPEL